MKLSDVPKSVSDLWRGWVLSRCRNPKCGRSNIMVRPESRLCMICSPRKEIAEENPTFLAVQSHRVFEPSREHIDSMVAMFRQRRMERGEEGN